MCYIYLRKLTTAVFVLVFMAVQLSAQEQVPANAVYKSSRAPIEARVTDLLERMTVEEKVGQLTTLLGWKMYTKTGNSVEASEALKTAIEEQKIGALWGVMRADPWTQKTLLK